MRETTEFPPRCAFNSALNEEMVDENEYIFAQEIYQRFKFRNFLEYCEFYCSLGEKMSP